MCSASCGGGSRTRTIFCTEENGNETTKVNKSRNTDNLNISFVLNSGILAGILSVPVFFFCSKTTTIYSFPPCLAPQESIEILFSSYSRGHATTTRKSIRFLAKFQRRVHGIYG